VAGFLLLGFASPRSRLTNQRASWRIANIPLVHLIRQSLVITEKPRFNHPMISEAKRAQVIEALKLNPNGDAIARKVGGITPQTVRAIAKQTGIPLAAENLKKAKRLSPEKRAQIIEALKANPNGNLVARQVGGISSRTVQKIAEQAGIRLLTTGDRHWRALERSREGAVGSPS
jgi:hypothetical protein